MKTSYPETELTASRAAGGGQGQRSSSSTSAPLRQQPPDASAIFSRTQRGWLTQIKAGFFGT
jgi:hypothetical protein